MEKRNLSLAASALNVAGDRSRDHRRYRARSTPLNISKAHHYA